MQITTAGKTTDYFYDADGIRSTRIVNGTEHEYLPLNGKVVYEKIGDGDTVKVIGLSYGDQDHPFAVNWPPTDSTGFTNYSYHDSASSSTFLTPKVII